MEWSALEVQNKHFVLEGDSEPIVTGLLIGAKIV